MSLAKLCKTNPYMCPDIWQRWRWRQNGGGAAGIRANSPADIRSIKQTVSLPVIGIWKVSTPGSDVFITPTMEAAQAVYEAGADIIALDCTFRKNIEGRWAWELIKEIKQRFNIPILADISTVEEGLHAQSEGADMVSTTLSGYTSNSPALQGPDFTLIKQLAQKLDIPVTAEGRIWTVEEAQKAIDLGAYALIIGGAITRPMEITKRFVKAIQKEN